MMGSDEETLLRAFGRKYIPSKSEVLSYEPGRALSFSIEDRLVTMSIDGGLVKEESWKKDGFQEYLEEPAGMRAKIRNDFTTDGVLKEIEKSLGRTDARKMRDASSAREAQKDGDKGAAEAPAPSAGDGADAGCLQKTPPADTVSGIMPLRYEEGSRVRSIYPSVTMRFTVREDLGSAVCVFDEAGKGYYEIAKADLMPEPEP